MDTSKLDDTQLRDSFKRIKEDVQVPQKILNIEQEGIKFMNSDSFLPHKRRRVMLPVALIAIFLMVSSTVVYAISHFVFLNSSYPIDKGLNIAEEKGKVTYFNNVYVEDKGIILKVNGILVDGLRSAIEVSVSGKLSGKGIPELKGVTLQEQNGKMYLKSHSGAGTIDQSKKGSENTHGESMKEDFTKE